MVRKVGNAGRPQRKDEWQMEDSERLETESTKTALKWVHCGKAEAIMAERGL